MALHAIRRGDPQGAPPLILLHGFGGCAEAWLGIMDRLPADLPVIAYDLPGHGGSMASDGVGHAGAMARAILRDLRAQGIQRMHLAGHSMGGAVAALMALKAADQVASLTLLAPGGLGSDINHRALRRYGTATSIAQLRQALEPMIGFNAVIPEQALLRLWEARCVPGAAEALLDILQHITNATGEAVFQGVLPLDALRGLTMPLSLLWGTQDMILPVAQAQALEGRADIHILEGVGHMLIEETPDAVVAALIRQLSRP
ncbi:alpha/beta fold hydrolase [Rhizobium sp. RU36D]|uniref:alpha/beta fold hydrolase n=1 Tax=Rhizobium sp. RU36D TaxID=1907415 RepID=UPI0009D80A73|nr:alpha/beta fold hydrolase [Rhizobium sp. RU36D]SMC62308.1 pyruvate dehydrogenase E2 component (dihydrolipoamide acetyltransferase) [Rhizobium sp. RU36D]